MKLAEVLSLVILLFALASPHALAADASVPAVRFEQKLGSQVPLNTVFMDEQGQPVKLSELMDGKPTILTLVYYGCPNLCTWVLNGLVSTMRDLPLKLGTQYHVISISIDAREKPKLAEAKRRSYLARYGITETEAREAAGWRFLTGTRESIDRVTEAVGFHYRFDFSAGEYAHPSGFVVLSPQGKVSRYFFGARFDSHELQAALESAGKGKIASLIDDVLLLCSHYNPSSSKMGQRVIESIRIGALAFAAFMVSMIVWLIRQERRA